MEKLFCSSCNAKSIDEGKTILYECRVRTNSNFEYTDWYKTPQEIGYHEIAVQIRKIETANNKYKFVPVARLGAFISE